MADRRDKVAAMVARALKQPDRVKRNVLEQIESELACPDCAWDGNASRIEPQAIEGWTAKYLARRVEISHAHFMRHVWWNRFYDKDDNFDIDVQLDGSYTITMRPRRPLPKNRFVPNLNDELIEFFNSETGRKLGDCIDAIMGNRFNQYAETQHDGFGTAQEETRPRDWELERVGRL